MVCGHKFKEHMELHCNWTTPYNKNIDEVYQQALLQSDDYQTVATSNTKSSHSTINKSIASDKINSRTQNLREDSCKPMNYRQCYLARNSSITTKPVPVKSRGIVILARFFLFQMYRSEVGRLIQLENIDNEEYNRNSMYRHGK
jgi:hypothetical protein